MSTSSRAFGLQISQRAILDTVDDRMEEHRIWVEQARRSGLLNKPDSPLILMADGDSWFNFPGAPGGSWDDTITCLQGKGAPHGMKILNFAHWGDAMAREVLEPSRLNQMRIALSDPDTYGAFDGVLISGGGNDIVGCEGPFKEDQSFANVLNKSSLVGGDPSRALNHTFDQQLLKIKDGYKSLIEFRDKHLAEKPIFVNGYDNAIPNGIGCMGSRGWMRPGLEAQGWTNLEVNTAIVRLALERFRALFAPDGDFGSNGVFLVDTVGTLTSNQWANELHPSKDGFELIAAKFLGGFRAHSDYANRI